MRPSLLTVPEEIRLEIFSHLYPSAAPETCLMLNYLLKSETFDPALAQVPDISASVKDAFYSAATGCVLKTQVRRLFSLCTLQVMLMSSCSVDGTRYSP
jgi:hypothetical protein